MARWPFSRSDRNDGGALVAAGARIRLTDRKVKRPKPAEWQTRAWDFFDDLGEIKFGYRNYGAAMSMVRLYVGVLMDGNDAPVPVQDVLAGVASGRFSADEIPPGLTDQTAVLAVEMLRRISSPLGGQAAIMRELSMNLGIAGECYLVGRLVDGVEVWDVLSVDELRSAGGGRWEIVTGPGKGEELDPETSFLLRVWSPHPRRSVYADSNMRGVLDRCEELMLLQQGDMAIAQSRIANTGVLYVSNDLKPVGPVKPRGPDDPPTDPFFESLIESWTTAVSDPGDASAIVPPIVRGDGPLDDRIAWVFQARDIGDDTGAKQERLVRRIAQGLDMAVERLLGLGDTSTYANALLVTQDEFTTGYKPTSLTIADAITVGWEQPGLIEALTEAGWTPDRISALVERIVVWYDPDELIFEPTAKDDTKWAHEAGLISDDAARVRLSIDPEEAPDDEELAARAEQGRLGRATQPQAMLPAARGQNAITAGAPSTPTQRRLDVLASRQSQIDRALAARLLAASSHAVDDALRIAGARLRSTVQSNSALRSAVRGLPAAGVGHAVGARAARALDITADTLLAGAFDDLGATYDDLVGRAQQSSLTALRRAGATLSDRQLDETNRQFDDDRRDGWQYLAAALLALAGRRIFDPTVVEPAAGEFDPTLTVAPGLIRQTLTAAGGQTSGATVGPNGGVPVLATAEGVQPAGQVATGPTVSDLIRTTLRARLVGWTWEHGALGEPARPFDPHVELDGVEFDSWQASVLANVGGDWPFVDFYHPGDHDYCTCGFANRFAPAD